MRSGLVLLLACACARASAPTAAAPASKSEPTMSELSAADIAAIVDAPDRTPADREDDARRKPAELLAFLRVRRGMRVADLGAAFGYTTELLARAVGPSGRVYGQNPQFLLAEFVEPAWSERLAKPVNANVIRVDREFVDPLPAEARDLDLVVNVLFYHDFAWLKVDRPAHNAAIFAALRSGGRYVIVDSSAAAGAGDSVSKSLHRVEESLVVEELQAAGFRLVAEADFLRNPDDSRDFSALPWQNDRPDFSDKFVLAFEKP